MESNQKAYYKSPLGIVEIIGDNKAIQSIKILEENHLSNQEKIWVKAAFENPNNTPVLLRKCITQLQEYFDGTRTSFDLYLNPIGTSFQKKVWRELLNIPFGKTRTYLEQSKLLGDPKAIRAVASANGKNPLWIVVPCHRIIGSDGSLTGYAGGLWRKQWLLNHESPNKQQSLF